MQVPVSTLTVGSRFVVRPGEKIATDGVVESGSSAVDASMLTGSDQPYVVKLVGSLEHASEHPVARAIATAATEPGGPLFEVSRFTNHQGLGVEGMVDGHAVIAGRAEFLASRGIVLSDELGPGRR